ncbi:hypothetical protein RAD16_10235 [Bradyrhizobium sp. 18BD]
MTIRSRREAVAFRIRGSERVLPGAYKVLMDEETIEGPSFSACRHTARTITVLVEGPCEATELLSAGSDKHAHARAVDASISQ